MARSIGFIGLGNMGSRLAANLAEDHGSITVWDRDPEKRDSEAPAGAKQTDSIEELIEQTDAIFISVFDDDAVREVVGHILKQDLSDKIIVDFSTIDPDTSIELAGKITDKGGQLLDAAISGSTPQVEARELVIFVGGPQKAYEIVRPMIEPLGKATRYMGDNGSGLKMKLCVNALLGTGIAALAEALTLAEKLGLEKSVAIKALAGTAVMSPSQTAKLELAKQDNYSTVTFSLDLMHKDLDLILDEADDHGLNLPVTEAAHRLATIGLEQSEHGDFAVMIQVAERLAGLKPASQ